MTSDHRHCRFAEAKRQCHRKDIAHRVKRIGVVHDGCASAVDREIAESAAVVVGVECLRAVAVFQVAALLELVIAQFGDVVIAV